MASMYPVFTHFGSTQRISNADYYIISSTKSGVAARAAEFRKHSENDIKCAQLSWKLVVESYGAWGPEALRAFSQVATRLAIRGSTYKSN